MYVRTATCTRTCKALSTRFPAISPLSSVALQPVRRQFGPLGCIKAQEHCSNRRKHCPAVSAPLSVTPPLCCASPYPLRLNRSAVPCIAHVNTSAYLRAHRRRSQPAALTPVWSVCTAQWPSARAHVCTWLYEIWPTYRERVSLPH